MAQNGFIENSTIAYSYDANGNLSNDTDKGVTYTYNHLNLPYVATKGSDMVEWIYTAAGEKIRKTTTKDGTPTSKDYHGSTESDPDGYVVYHAEGQVRQVDNALHWEYALRDHLGNTRILYEENNNSLDILQNNQYYAFGMSMYGEWSKQGMSENDYKYNGKELNSDLGLGLYDYGARFYDPVVGRFMSVDPLADQRSWLNPYNYVQNNPIIRIDPTGMLDTFPGPSDMISAVGQGLKESYIKPIGNLLSGLLGNFNNDGEGSTQKSGSVLTGENGPGGQNTKATEMPEDEFNVDEIVEVSKIMKPSVASAVAKGVKLDLEKDIIGPVQEIFSQSNTIRKVFSRDSKIKKGIESVKKLKVISKSYRQSTGDTLTISIKE